jgi:HAD superfamily hydrolase (TIGR01509 family)
MAPRPGHVVFDLDGLIVDSEPTQERATDEYLAGFGTGIDPGLADDMMGRRVRDLTDAIAPRIGLTSEAAFAGREEVLWRLLEAEPLPPMPGLYGALERLAGAGLPLAVASSGTRAYVAHVLERLGVRDAFAAVVSGEDVANGKPDPEIYLLTARRLGAAPVDCVAVEDAPSGITAARDAGMQVVAVPNPLTARLDLEAADVVVGDLEAAAAWILGRR